jgi:predicted membrane channel-forming protein YqfA (hemolysin III family)
MYQQSNFQAVERRQSRLGIWSVVIGLLLPVLLAVFIACSVALDTRKDSPAHDILVTFFVISLFFPLLHLVGLIFGIIGAFSKKTKKLFPITGICINGFLLVLVALFLALIVPNLGSAFAFR